MSDSNGSTSMVFRLGHEELVVRRRYETLSVVNDVLIALWFIVGSILFFDAATTTLGTCMFLAGSCELAIRPMIRLARHVHLRRLPFPSESGQDF